MPESFETFVNSLDLPANLASDLTADLARDSRANTTATLACKTALKLLGSDVVAVPPLNQSTVDINWSQACWEEPSCIIQVKTTEHVATALKIINQFEVQFAVRSGGHSPNPGWASITAPGILLDLSGLNAITVSEDSKTISIGPGQRWGNVFDALAPYRVSVIGGRIPNVGVGGLMLGGGYFHFSGQYGLAADNVKEFEVVLANGTIATVNAGQNSDLFWALKGGGPNFGIVTRYELYTVPVFDIWYEVLAVSNDQAHAVLEAFASWQDTNASDVKATVALIMGLESITLGFIYSQPAMERPAAFSNFDSITPLATAVPPTNGTVVTITELFGSTFSNVPARHDYRSAASKIDGQLYKDVYDYWFDQATAVHASTGANQTFTLQPIPAQLVQAGLARGGNPMGIPMEDHQWWTTLVDWNDAADDDTVRNVSINTSNKWKELGEQRELYIDYLYTNDASRDQNPMATYGEDNIIKLRGIAEKYDPNQVFQKLQDNGFLLRRV
ncbi:hypothetical protein VPNG_05896 [Cytospora leucostoma]|uniref:FAD-binding PCMH-type domain-containing protein n=1 Tax=Cytospora leucostoma TaxID=1230097 RepID=A0A423X0C3_9PEZI|nr:hypothetical protein VPNG_05896 [Cytospora leucostoma]